MTENSLFHTLVLWPNLWFCFPSQLSINCPQRCSAVTWGWTIFGLHLKGFLLKGSRFLRRVGSTPPLRWVNQRHFIHTRIYFLLNGTIKFTKSCWQPLGQGWRRRQLRRVVNVSDSQSSSPGFEFHSGHYLKLFHVILEFSSSATLVNNRLVWF